MALTKLNYTGQGTIPIASIPTITGAKMPAGSVLQTITSPFNSIKAVNSTSYIAMGHSLQITPLSTSSKILLRVSGGYPWNGNNLNIQKYFTIYRDSTDLGNLNYGLEGLYSNTYFAHPHSFEVYDTTHNTTSQITYAIYGRGSNTAVGYYSAGSGGPTGDPTTILFTAMEIKG